MSQKPLLVIVAPLSSRSGYGDHARDLFHSFYNLNKYEVQVGDVPWGSCPRNALDENNPKDKLILDSFIKGNSLKKQPDVYVDIRIPQEFQTIGKYNIGITAGIETNAVSQAFLEGVNKMDLTIVPSEHSKSGFVNSKYDKMQQLPDGKQQKIGELRLEKPMEVLFEGVDLDVWKPLTKDEIDSDFFNMLNEKVPEKFAYLVVGQWVKGNFGEDRKDLAKTIKLFLETFANRKKQPALIMKTSGASFSILDKVEMESKIRQIKDMFPKNIKLPNIYLLHGDLSEKEMNYLYNHPKIKSLISFTHGEGYGRPMLEASMTGLPVIASGWSGQVDFLDAEFSLLVNGSLDKVPQSAVWENIIISESSWFNIDQNHAKQLLDVCYSETESVKRKAKELMDVNRNKFSHDDMTVQLGKILDNHVISQVKVNLPELKKVEPKSKKIKLPKLEVSNE